MKVSKIMHVSKHAKNTPLLQAILDRDNEEIKGLIDDGESIDIQDGDGVTPLM